MEALERREFQLAGYLAVGFEVVLGSMAFEVVLGSKVMDLVVVAATAAEKWA